MMHAQPERPVPFQGDLRNLPKALEPLKERRNWVCWRWEWRVDKKGVGKWTKPPFQPDNCKKYAKNNDPKTWGTYEQALAAFEAGQCDGIGFNLFGTDIAAFDVDECRDPATGAIAPEAMAIVDRAASYTETTVSATGLRVIGIGAGPKVHRKQKLPGSAVEVESYRGAERYIVITGNPLPDTWPHMADIGDTMDAIVAELDGRADAGHCDDEPDLSDEFAFKPKADPAGASSGGDTGDAFLPSDLIELIERGVSPDADLSAAFHHCVCWLADCGWSADRIEARIAGKPIVPARFAKRLGQEIARCLHKRKVKAEAEAKCNPGSSTPNQGPQGAGQGSQQAPPQSGKGKSGAANSGGPTAPANSEEFLTLIFIDRHEGDLRFVAKWGQWFRWDGSRWELEETLYAFDMARLICREAANACNKSSTAKMLASAKTVAAVERLAKADRKIAATFEQWDINFSKFNTSEEE